MIYFAKATKIKNKEQRYVIYEVNIYFLLRISLILVLRSIYIFFNPASLRPNPPILVMLKRYLADTGFSTSLRVMSQICILQWYHISLPVFRPDASGYRKKVSTKFYLIYLAHLQPEYPILKTQTISYQDPLTMLQSGKSLFDQ